MIRAAFRDQTEASDLVIEKVVFLSPLALDDGQDREVRLIATGKPNGYGLQIRSVAGQGASGETRYQDHVNCQVRVQGPEETRRHDIEALRARCDVRKPDYADRGDAAAAITGERNRSFYVGKRWQKLLKDVRATDNEIIAFLELPEEYSEDLERLGIHPAMMDVATGILQMLGDGSYLPLAYERVVIKRPFTRRIYSHLKLKDGRFSTSDVIAGDIIIMDEEGYELVRIEEYTVRKVSASALAPRLSMSDSTFNKTPAPVGLLPREGAEVFMKIMTAGPSLSQIAVSTRDLGALMEQASKSTGTQIIEQVERLQASRPRHPRPAISAQYEQARTDLERSLVKLWQETLNVEEVGIHDNFFELGGDSLLATQLIARISQSFNVDLSLRSMFEAPTITGLAHSIVHHQAEATNEDLLESALREIRQMSAGDLRQALAAEKAAGDEGASHE
jgi:acyl carrier protein